MENRPAEAIVAAGLVRSFDRRRALDGLSLRVGRGELYGLVGPDGAGKSTTLFALSGLLPVDRGEIRIQGRDPFRDASVRRLVGLVTQDQSLYRDLTVAENLRFFSRLFGLSRKQYAERSEHLLAIMRLADFRDRRADALSGGMYKKLALACALLHEPDVLLLDEPTNGVDPVSRRELWELLYDFVARGMTVLVSTPYMDEAERCGRVGLLHEGRLLVEGSPKTLVRDSEHASYVLADGDADSLTHVLSDIEGVVAVSRAARVARVIVRRDGEERALAKASSAGARLVPSRLRFEDLFLARVLASNGGRR